VSAIAEGKHVLTLILVSLLQQAAPAPAVTPEDPGKMQEQKIWTGCLQAGSTPSAYRLTLDPGTAVSGPDDPASLGDPFVQLIGNTKKLDFATHVGKHVRVSGKELSPEEAEREATLRPDQQEANATAAGLGGRAQRHLRYVRVESISSTSGSCR
jgi:hypothetical protein